MPRRLNYDAIHDTVHEMCKDEARHGKAFKGLAGALFRLKYKSIEACILYFFEQANRPCPERYGRFVALTFYLLYATFEWDDLVDFYQLKGGKLWRFVEYAAHPYSLEK